MLTQCADMGVVGGTIYDGLLAACALKAKARTLFTWNLRHYEQLGTDVRRILKTP
jgi:predicted nucleic acid-binding protein